MGDTRAFKEELARRLRIGVRRYMERKDLWAFGPTDLANLIEAEGVPCKSWTVSGWFDAKHIPKYDAGMALARILDLDYHEMMARAPEAPQTAEDATEGRPALRVTSTLTDKKKPATVKRGAK